MNPKDYIGNREIGFRIKKVTMGDGRDLFYPQRKYILWWNMHEQKLFDSSDTTIIRRSKEGAQKVIDEIVLEEKSQTVIKSEIL